MVRTTSWPYSTYGKCALEESCCDGSFTVSSDPGNYEIRADFFNVPARLVMFSLSSEPQVLTVVICNSGGTDKNGLCHVGCGASEKCAGKTPKDAEYYNECCFGCYSVDLNDDGTVNIRDLFPIAKAFGTELGDPNWNEIADLNKDDQVDIKDIFMVAKKYGIDCPWRALTVDCDEIAQPDPGSGNFNRNMDDKIDWCMDGSEEDMTVTCVNQPVETEVRILTCPGNNCWNKWTADQVCKAGILPPR
jgi:hypothetical protein